MEIDSAVQQRLTKSNQTHLLTYWSELNDEQRNILLHDIAEVDFERVQHAYEAIKDELSPETTLKAPQAIDDMMEPIPDHMAGSIDESSKEQLENYRQKGLKAVSEGSVCVLLLAGGQGTRLGRISMIFPSLISIVLIQVLIIQKECSTLVFHQKNLSIKFKLNVFVDSNNWQMKNILMTNVAFPGSSFSASSPFSNRSFRFIMTSEHTQEQTEKYFRSHNYFGLKRENLILFEQHTLPALDFQGKIILEEKYRLTKAADGNGGLYRALKTRGVLNEMTKRHVKYVHVYGVDNILVRLADPVFIGFCLKKSADCAAKVN